MSYTIYALTFLLAAIICTSGQIYSSEDFPNEQNTMFKSNSENSCHGARGTRHISSYPLLKILGIPKISDNIEDYPEATNEDYTSQLDYIDLERRPMWSKRSSVSPFISLGALSNLPQFFEKLKGTMDKLDKPGMHQAYNLVSLPQSAAQGECQRRRQPDRRNRSRKHDLSSCMIAHL